MVYEHASVVDEHVQWPLALLPVLDEAPHVLQRRHVADDQMHIVVLGGFLDLKHRLLSLLLVTTTQKHGSTSLRQLRRNLQSQTLICPGYEANPSSQRRGLRHQGDVCGRGLADCSIESVTRKVLQAGVQERRGSEQAAHHVALVLRL